MPEIPQQTLPSPRPALPFVALESRFLRRTFWASVVTMVLVALNVAVYINPVWAGWYLVAGAWAMVFFTLTPLILKELLFDRRRGRAIWLVAAKLAWMGLMVGICMVGSRSEAGGKVFGTALVAGITTPLGVVLLRTLGAAMSRPAAGQSKGQRPAETLGSRS